MTNLWLGKKYFLAVIVVVLCGLPNAPYAQTVSKSDPTVSHLTDPNFFPIGVWLQKPALAEQFKELGINFYSGLWKGPTSAQLARLKKANMPVITTQNDIALNDPNNDIILAWAQRGEPDNAQKRRFLFWPGKPIPPVAIIREYKKMRQRDSTRPVFMNFGQGLAWDGWHGRETRNGHPEDYAEYVKGADILSFDIYPVTHPNKNVAGRLEFIANGIARLRKLAPPGARVWNVVGASRVQNRDVKPTPKEIWNQVWLSIASGSRGIIYFGHQFEPEFSETAILDDEKTANALKRINTHITELAPVLNAPTIPNLAAISPKDQNVDLASLGKILGCAAYLFSASKSNHSGEMSFRILRSDLIGPVTVIGENRSLRLSGKKFDDHYNPYEAHIYKFQIRNRSCPM